MTIPEASLILTGVAMYRPLLERPTESRQQRAERKVRGSKLVIVKPYKDQTIARSVCVSIRVIPSGMVGNEES